MKYELTYIINMEVEAESEDSAFYNTAPTADFLLEEGIARLDELENIEVKECRLEWTRR